jgi:hypothetical protein
MESCREILVNLIMVKSASNMISKDAGARMLGRIAEALRAEHGKSITPRVIPTHIQKEVNLIRGSRTSEQSYNIKQ